MSASPNIGSVDLEAVLSVGRRRLLSIDEGNFPYQQCRYTDAIYLKRECALQSIFSIHSRILIFGDLQFLCNIFERYKSNITVYENVSANNELTVSKENQNTHNDEENATTLPPLSTRRETICTFERLHRTSSTTSDYTVQRFEGKIYGCIELPDMNLIEILEILLHCGLELVHQSNDYDKTNVLHQSFIFSKPSHSLHKSGPTYYARRPSFLGTS